MSMSTERRVKIFRSGVSQAVQIPKEFEFSGEEAVMRKKGNCLIIGPTAAPSLVALLKTLKPLEEDFEDIPDPEPEPVDL